MQLTLFLLQWHVADAWVLEGLVEGKKVTYSKRDRLRRCCVAIAASLLRDAEQMHTMVVGWHVVLSLQPVWKQNVWLKIINAACCENALVTDVDMLANFETVVLHGDVLLVKLAIC